MREFILELLAAEPFTAFKIVVNSGHEFEIVNADLAIMERDVRTIYRTRADGRDVLRLTEITFVGVSGPVER